MKSITVGELCEILKGYSKDIPIIDALFCPIEGKIKVIDNYITGQLTGKGEAEKIKVLQLF